MVYNCIHYYRKMFLGITFTTGTQLIYFSTFNENITYIANIKQKVIFFYYTAKLFIISTNLTCFLWIPPFRSPKKPFFARQPMPRTYTPISCLPDCWCKVCGDVSKVTRRKTKTSPNNVYLPRVSQTGSSPLITPL